MMFTEGTNNMVNKWKELFRPYLMIDNGICYLSDEAIEEANHASYEYNNWVEKTSGVEFVFCTVFNRDERILYAL